MGIVHPGERNPNWRGGRSIASNGYILLRRPGHRLADVRGYVYEHRLVAEAKIRRQLRPGEVVHHVNGDKADNRSLNITVLPSQSVHRIKHEGGGNPLRRKQGEPNPVIVCRCGCGERFTRFDSSGRPRAFVTGHNMN